MVWTEIDVDRHLTDADLRNATAQTFGIAPERVRVVASLTSDTPRLDPDISLLIEHWSQPGEFPERVSFVMWDGALIERIGEREGSSESYALLTTLASHLNASIIASDSGVNPYLGLLIQPLGDVYRMELDQETLDDLGGIALPAKSAWTRVPELSHLPQRRLLTS